MNAGKFVVMGILTLILTQCKAKQDGDNQSEGKGFWSDLAQGISDRAEDHKEALSIMNGLVDRNISCEHKTLIDDAKVEDAAIVKPWLAGNRDFAFKGSIRWSFRLDNDSGFSRKKEGSTKQFKFDIRNSETATRDWQEIDSTVEMEIDSAKKIMKLTFVIWDYIKASKIPYLRGKYVCSDITLP